MPFGVDHIPDSYIRNQQANFVWNILLILYLDFHYASRKLIQNIHSMKKILFASIGLILLLTEVHAQQITIDEAKTVARNFYFERINQYEVVDFQDIKIVQIFEVTNNDDLLYLAVNMHPSGFVIISGQKTIVPVLAYSFHSIYSETDQPPQFNAWMKQYQDQIAHAISNPCKTDQKIQEEWNRLLSNNPDDLKPFKNEKSVEPLLLSSWDQGTYYNQMCPADPAGPSGHCYTGCVATAMGQLCYYFRWPDEGVGSYTYEHNEYGTITANFEGTFYDWFGMTNVVSSQNLSVAELLFHLGVSVDMVYGPDGSGMYNHKAAYSLRTYFKYSPETEYLYRDSTNLDWDSTIVAHLDQRIPMYYAGWSVPNIYGHAFIVDGYQTEEYFHFNWGWSGSFDGYFYLDNLTPGGSNFNLAQELIINCFPDTVNYTYPLYCQETDTLTNLNGSIDDGSGPVYPYQIGASCFWLINPQSIQDSVTNIEISFDRLNTQAGTDLLTIYDGESISSPVLGLFSGNELPDNLSSTGNKVLISFTSDGNNNFDGWFISYESNKPEWCSGMEIYTDPTGTVNDGSGSFYYQNGTNCLWQIQPPDATKITLTFSEFMTEEDKDFVKIYDATTNQLLASYSGIYDMGILPEPVVCENGKMFIAFQSNGTVQEQGWSAFYTINTVGLPEEENIKNEGIFCYPNPVNGKLNVVIHSNEAKTTIYTLKSMEGRLIKSGMIDLKPDNNILEFDLTEEKNGIYLLQLTNFGKTVIKKIIKTR
jgi:hypothetical protein